MKDKGRRIKLNGGKGPNNKVLQLLADGTTIWTTSVTETRSIYFVDYLWSSVDHMNSTQHKVLSCFSVEACVSTDISFASFERRQCRQPADVQNAALTYGKASR